MHHRDQLVLVAVDAAIRHEADEVEAGRLRFFQRFSENRIAGQCAFCDCLVDAGEVLVNDATRAEVEVADLRVTHLAWGQADIEAGSAQEGGWVGGEHLVMEWGLGEQHGIAVLFCGCLSSGVEPPAVADDQHYWFLCHDGWRCTCAAHCGQVRKAGLTRKKCRKHFLFWRLERFWGDMAVNPHALDQTEQHHANDHERAGVAH